MGHALGVCRVGARGTPDGVDGDKQPDEMPDPKERYRRGLPNYHNPMRGIGGAAPTYSALTLRLGLAIFGFVVCVAVAIWLLMIDAPAPFVMILVLLAIVAVIDLAVIVRRKRRGEPG